MTTERFRKQAEDYISETLVNEIPDVSVDPGSAANNILVRAGSVITAGLHQEINHILASRDISNPEAISEADMDRNMGDLLVKRDAGELSKGFINIHFPDRRARTITQGTRASTADSGLSYVVPSDMEFVASDYIVDTSDNSYYLRVPFVAEAPGPEYDVDVGEVNNLVDNRLGALYITNPEKFLGGRPAQSNTELLRSGRRAVSTRTPLNIDGSLFTLERLFGNKFLDAMVVGNGDPEMLRDELYLLDGKYVLGPEGEPTGIHIGGRTDVYHWYPQVNYVEVTIDLTVDLVLSDTVNTGAVTLQAQFAPGTTSSNTVPPSGVLTLELGGSAEETVRYSSFTHNPATGVYVFMLNMATTLPHSKGATVKVGGNGEISVGPNGAISVLPILKVASVRKLDPLTLSPIGEPLAEVEPGNRDPGWYFEDQNKLLFMSAKETRTLRIDEKRDVAGNAPLSGVDGSTSATRRLHSLSVNFLGYQGREITISDGATSITRTILRVVSLHEIEYSDGPEEMPDGSGRSFSVEGNFGDFLAYPIRVGFYTHTEIQEAQKAFDKGRVRIMCSDILSRAFLPVFLDFTLRFKGPGSEEEVREKILELIQEAQGENLGSNQGARFDVSDLVAAAYDDGLANYVETPFEIKITKMMVDGSKEVRWVSPSRDTVNDLVVATAAEPGDTVLVATRPAQVPASAIPEQGRLFLGVYVGSQEEVTYNKVVFSGENMIFVLTENEELRYSHGMNEPLRVSVPDFHPDNVISDGVIADDRQHRPYFGKVVVEKIT